jgi:hypothetical protein
MPCVCMYVCMYVSILCVCMYVYIYIYIYIYRYIHIGMLHYIMYVCKCICVCVCMYVCMYLCMYVCLCICVCMYVCIVAVQRSCPIQLLAGRDGILRQTNMSEGCDTLLHVVYTSTLQCSRGVRDSLDADLLSIATGEALVVIVFPPSDKLGVGGGSCDLLETG